MNAAPQRPPARKLLFAAAALSACACLLAAALAAGRVGSAQEGGGPPQRAEAEGKEERRVAVYGRAVYEGTNRPVRRAQVMLLGDDGRAREHAALTDAEGRFRIRGVPPGHYFAFVNLSGVLSPVSFIAVEELRTGAPDFHRPELKGYFEEVEVGGKDDKEVTVYARRGAALGGKVTYSNGDPAVNVQIHVMRRSGKRLTRFLTGATPAAIFSMTTDDRGLFRVAGLPPGEYVVGVSESSDHAGDGSGSTPSEYIDSQLISAITGDPLLMTYHPSAARAEDAAAVKVEAGDERDDVDITIADRALRTLAGVVRGRGDRRPVQGVRVVLVRKSEAGGGLTPAALSAYEGSTPAAANTDGEGRWRLRDIPDGEYALHLTPPEEYETPGGAPNMNYNMNSAMDANTSAYVPPRRKRKYAPARRELRVTADVDELAIELGEGARVSGSIVVEGGRVPEYSGIFLAPVAPEAAVLAAHQMPGVTVFRGEFAIEGVAPGSYRLYPQDMSSPGDGRAGPLYLKSITWNGRDLMREPLEITEGARVEGVRVVYARDPARLRVRVLRPGDRRPVAAAIVFLLPPDAAGWSVYARTPQCITGDDGACEISAGPGDYSPVVLSNPRAGRAPDFEANLKRRAPAAPRLTLRAGETSTFELTLPEGN